MAQAAGEVKIILAVDGASYSAALDKAKQQLKQLEGAVGSAGEKTRAEMREATASIALFGEEFGVHLPRHVRSFVASLPGVASAMSAAFSGAAILAIGMALYETGKKIYEFVQKSEEAARKNAAAWREVAAPMQATNDALAVTNDRLEESIAKLEHKPQNGLKEAIDEAIESADKLGAKLTADQLKIVETLKAQEVSTWSRIMGTAGTGDLAKRGEALQEELDKTDISGRAHLEELKKQGATQKQIDDATRDLNAERKKAIDAEMQWASGELKTAQELEPKRGRAGGGGPSQLERIRQLTEYSAALGRESDFVAETQQNIDLSGREATDRAAAGNLAAQKQASEARKQANAKQIEEWRRHLTEVEALTDLSKQDEANYWKGLADSIKNNAPLALEAQNEANRAQAAANKQFSESLIKQWTADAADYQRKRSDDERIHNEVMAGLAASERDVEEQTRNQRQGARDNFAAAAEEIDAAMREGEENIRTTRGLSRLDAARALQQLHAAGADQWTQALGVAQNAGAGISLKDIERHGAVEGRQAQVDDAAVESATALGALKDSASELATRFTDMPAAIHEAVGGIIGTTNDALMSTLTDRYHRGNWKQAGRSIFSGVTKTGLEMAEGSLLKGIPGVGARGSGWTNPIFAMVKSADLASTAGGVTSALGGAATGAGSALGKAASWALSAFFPHAAEGGPIATNMPTLVGEQGPELFMPAGAGRIIPNSALGGDTNHVWNIDARGSNDPAAVRAAVQRGILEAAPRIAAGSIAASREIASRKPVMSR